MKIKDRTIAKKQAGDYFFTWERAALGSMAYSPSYAICAKNPLSALW
jgi:hypothetical protein